MTDEEMAEEYSDTVKCEWENDTYWVDCREKVTDAFLAGAEFGYVKGIEEVLSKLSHHERVKVKTLLNQNNNVQYLGQT